MSNKPKLREPQGGPRPGSDDLGQALLHIFKQQPVRNLRLITLTLLAGLAEGFGIAAMQTLLSQELAGASSNPLSKWVSAAFDLARASSVSSVRTSRISIFESFSASSIP